jgi:hypothetical protein
LGVNQSGEIRFTLPRLSEGVHKIELKAWDIFNNSSFVTTQFRVVQQQKIDIQRFYNYPNPFRQSTVFSIEMSGPTGGATFELTLVANDGKRVKSIPGAINQDGVRFLELKWDRKDSNGNLVSPGLYFGILVIKTKFGSTTSVNQKLILL